MMQATDQWTATFVAPLNAKKRTRNNAYLSLLKFYRHTQNYHAEAVDIADDSGLNVDRAWAITLEENLQQLRHTLRLLRA